MLRTMCQILFSAPEDKEKREIFAVESVCWGRWTIRSTINKLPDRLGVGKCY